jgi:purine-cytosine permease-like protein
MSNLRNLVKSNTNNEFTIVQTHVRRLKKEKRRINKALLGAIIFSVWSFVSLCMTGIHNWLYNAGGATGLIAVICLARYFYMKRKNKGV